MTCAEPLMNPPPTQVAPMVSTPTPKPMSLPASITWIFTSTLCNTHSDQFMGSFAITNICSCCYPLRVVMCIYFTHLLVSPTLYFYLYFYLLCVCFLLPCLPSCPESDLFCCLWNQLCANCAKRPGLWRTVHMPVSTNGDTITVFSSPWALPSFSPWALRGRIWWWQPGPPSSLPLSPQSSPGNADLFQNRENFLFQEWEPGWMWSMISGNVHLAGHHVGDVGVDAGVEGSAQGRISHDALKIVSFLHLQLHSAIHSMPTQLKRVHCLGLKQLWSTDPTLSWDPQLHVSDWCFLGPVERVLQDEPPKQSCWKYQDFESCLWQWHVMFHEKMVE